MTAKGVSPLPPLSTGAKTTALRRALIGVAVALFAAGPLGQLLRLAEVPAADEPTRYEIVLAGLEHLSPAKTNTSSENEPQSKPKLLKPVTDLWDTAFAPNYAVDAPVAAQYDGFERPAGVLPTVFEVSYASHDPPPRHSRGPPTSA